MFKEKVIQRARKFLSPISPKFVTRITYRFSFGKKLNLKCPHTINEKIQWLKLNTYMDNPLVTQCADKYRVREYLKAKGLEELLPELYGVFNSADEIEWNALPNSFVAKCNHGCGYNLLVADKSELDYAKAKETLDGWLKEDYWKFGAETVYKDIKKKIIVEEYLGDNLSAYKFFCFNGQPKILYLTTFGRNEHGEDHCNYYIDYYNMNLDHLSYTLKGHHNIEGNIQKPISFPRMIEISQILSSDFPFVRVDLYDVNGKLYISELTFLPTGGYMHITPSSVLDEWGDWLNLEDIK